MSKPNRIAKNQGDKKSQHRPKPPQVTKPVQEAARPANLHDEPLNLSTRDPVEHEMMMRLIDPRIPIIQRHALVNQIGQLQGNHHLQKVVGLVNDEPKTGSTSSNPSEPLLTRNLIQRSDPATVTQWEADWNDPAFRNAQRYFKGDDRPAGTPKERYDVLCPLYLAHGISRPLKYVAENIETAKFFQFTTPAHRDLKAALARAESLLGRHPPDGPGYTQAPLISAWAFNPRTTSEGNWSNHADGKAIDLDPDTNIRLNKKSERQVISILTGYDMAKSNPGEPTGLESHEALEEANETFKADYNSTGMRQRIEELEGEEIFLENEKEAIELELVDVPQGKKASREDRERAKEIKQRLKRKKKEVKAKADERKVLEKELKKYKKEEKAYQAVEATIDALEGKIPTLQDEIELLEAELEGVVEKERLSTLKAELKAKRKDLKLAKKELKKAEKTRDEKYPMRRYARTGFFTLPEILVETLKAAGLEWGGDWGEPKAHKDLMHFQVP